VSEPDTLMTTEAAARYVGCTVDHLARLRMKRQGPAFFKHSALVRYRRSAIDDWISANTRPPG
jgi:hypothetical protein